MGLETSYYTLIHRLTHWCSIRWQKNFFTCDRFSKIGWARQLSMIINATFLPLAWNFLFTSLTQSSSKTLSIQLFLCDWYLQGSWTLPSKINFVICFKDSPLKIMKNAFYFTLKALFVFKIFKFLSWFFGHVEKTAWWER